MPDPENGLYRATRFDWSGKIELDLRIVPNLPFMTITNNMNLS